MATKRISDEPAYVLHRHDWSESSLILDVFTRHYGRIALVAKGVKRPSSSFRPILLPLQPLHVAFGGDAEIRTLKAAEWQGGHVMPSGEALLSGYHLNELVLTLLARDDPHPQLFDFYSDVVRVVAARQGEAVQTPLPAVEHRFLRQIGVLPDLQLQTLTLEPLQDAARYCLVPEGGLREAGAQERHALRGAQWQDLQRAMDEGRSFGDMLQACAPVTGELKAQLRVLLNYHCGTRTLRTRQMMIDLQTL